MEHIAAVVNRKPAKAPKSAQPGSAKTYYATEAQIQTQGDTLILGLKSVDTEPIAALALKRTEAHQILRMLKGQSDKAGWGLEQPADWMRPMEYGRGGD